MKLFIALSCTFLMSLVLAPRSGAWARNETPDFIVASGPLKTIKEATEYCAALGRKLPSEADALLIYQATYSADTMDTMLVNYDGNNTTGSFWTGDTGRSMTLFTSCPISLEILPIGASPRTSYSTVCGKSAKRLAVCVPDPDFKPKKTDEAPMPMPMPNGGDWTEGDAGEILQ